MLRQIAPRIRQVLPVAEPLSADAFIIGGDERYYIFDVGASDAAREAIAALDKPVTVILSHFHRDHTGNMSSLQVEEALVGARTRRYLGFGTLVESPLVIRDGVEIIVQPCVSPHAPGCLIATVDRTYTLVGDLHYARSGDGQGEARGMLNALKRLDTKYFIVSHAQGCPVIEGDQFLREAENRFGLISARSK